jgi:enoyl-CoA hydratase/carnithine racemase
MIGGVLRSTVQRLAKKSLLQPAGVNAFRNYVNLTKASSLSVAVLELDRAPVNSLSKEMADALVEAVKEAESDDKVQALVIKSSNPKIFSAGLDITEMNNPEVQRLEDFWRSIQVRSDEERSDE